MLLNLLFVTAICTSCSKDDEKEDEELEFVQIRVFSEDITAPNGQAYLFYVENNVDNIDNMKPSTLGDMYSPWIGYNRNLVMYPVSEFGKSTSGQLMVNQKKGYSELIFYWRDLSTTYGTPSPGRYVLFVSLSNGVYLRSYKELTITKNSIIEVSFPKANNTEYDVDANFVVKDYSEN